MPGLPPPGHNSYASRYAGNKDPRVKGNVGGHEHKVDEPPDRHELYLLGDSEKKVTFEVESRKCQHSVCM
jgi:hypothetical protein